LPTEKTAEPAEPRGSEAPAPATRRTRDYSQRPQKPIKLKPTIARERPSAVTRLGPPREQLAVAKGPTTATAPAAAPERATVTRVAEPPAVAPVAPVPAPLLPEEVQRAILDAARAARIPAGEWVARAARVMEAPAEKPVSYDEIIVYTLREMNQRLAGLERRGLGAWVAGWVRRGTDWIRRL
jgi:hypothetical protein